MRQVFSNNSDAFSFQNKRLCFLVLLVFMWASLIPVAYSAEITETNLAPLAAEEQTSTLPDAQDLARAGQLYREGDLENAAALYARLLQSQRPEIGVEAAFMLAQIHSDQAQYNQAIVLLIAILNHYPALPRVRLELARAYFLNENWDDARFHFELVKGSSNIPPEVLANIDLFLQAIRRNKNWSLEFGMGYIPDSNLNQASGNEEECIATVFGLLCRKMEDKQSGQGLSVSATGNYYAKISPNFGIRNTVGVYLKEYEEGAFDDYLLYAASGPRLLFGNSEISLQPTYLRRIHAGENYSESLGLRFDMQNDLGRLMLASGASFNKNNYTEDEIHALLKGQDYRAYVTPRFIISNRSFVQAGLEYNRDETAMDIYGSDRWTYRLGFYYFFKYGFSLFVEGSIEQAKYHESQWYITQDYRIDEAERRDWIRELTVELGTNIWEKQGIRPTLQYQYTKQDSNIWSREYNRHRLNLLLSFRF